MRAIVTIDILIHRFSTAISVCVVVMPGEYSKQAPADHTL